MGKDKIKIIFLVHTLDTGGIESYLLRFLRYFQGRFCPMVVTKSGKLGVLHEKYEAIDNIEIVPLVQGYFSPLSWWRLFRLFKKTKAQSVCDFTGNFSGIPLFLAWLAGVKIRIAAYRGSSNHFKEDIPRLLYNSCVRKITSLFATRIIANSYAALDFFFPKRKKSDERYKVIYNGIDHKEFVTSVDKTAVRQKLGIPDHAFLVGHSGRLDRSKNHETIIKVAIRLCKENDDICFLLCGLGVDKAYGEQIRSEGLEKRIFTPGYCDNMKEMLAIMDAYYFPSITEGQPNALIEAMICGIPIVASNIPAIQETVPAPFRSELVDPCSVEDACRNLTKVKENVNYRNKMSCKEWAIESFDAEKLYCDFLTVLIK